MISSRKLAPRGFTLIELLVVIAIIGILSAVVLASLNTARNKGNDAAVKSNLATIQTQAELDYDTYGNKYDNTASPPGFAAAACPTSGTTMFAGDPTVKAAIASAVSASGQTISATVCYMNAGGSAYAIQIPLKSSGYWCIDSTGAGKSEGSAFSGTVCN
jgi:prepilin-type N-terminal cleavage/methylation domain-containing protein